MKPCLYFKCLIRKNACFLYLNNNDNDYDNNNIIVRSGCFGFVMWYLTYVRGTRA
jgi:hypothetical protein